MEEAWKRKREAEAEEEAVDGRLKEAEVEAKEKLTAVPSLVKSLTYSSNTKNLILQLKIYDSCCFSSSDLDTHILPTSKAKHLAEVFHKIFYLQGIFRLAFTYGQGMKKVLIK